MMSNAFCFSFWYKQLEISTKVLVVPDMADKTTILGWLSEEIKFATPWILSALPTEVPPNFNTFILDVFIFV